MLSLKGGVKLTSWRHPWEVRRPDSIGHAREPVVWSCGLLLVFVVVVVVFPTAEWDYWLSSKVTWISKIHWNIGASCRTISLQIIWFRSLDLVRRLCVTSRVRPVYNMKETVRSTITTVAGSVTGLSVRLEMCGQCQRKKKQKKKIVCFGAAPIKNSSTWPRYR